MNESYPFYHLFENLELRNSKFFLHHADLTDSSSLTRVINLTEPSEIYNLGAQSHVAVSFEQPEYTTNCDGLGALRILEAVRTLKLQEHTKFYQASTSELYGKVLEVPQNEKTPFNPRSPYAVSKLYAYWATVNYREAYGIFASNGILFNHESPRRGETFVTRKITRGLAEIRTGVKTTVRLGNLNALRDWGHAKDYVKAMWMLMQHHEPIDLVFATGKQVSVRQFAEYAAKALDFDIEWRGSGLNEIGLDRNTGQTLIEVDERYFRPSEVDSLLGDPRKAEEILGWKAVISVEDLAKEMAQTDLADLQHSP